MAVFKNKATFGVVEDFDQDAKNELLAAGIPVLQLPTTLNTEVKTRYVGYLNGFVFFRAWRYWVCEGLMPIANAKEIFEQISAMAVRAGGSAANPVPMSMAVCPAATMRMRKEAERAHEAITDSKKRIEYLQQYCEEHGNAKPGEDVFVQVYHVDTEEGLKALAEYIRAHDVHAAAQTEEIYLESMGGQ